MSPQQSLMPLEDVLNYLNIGVIITGQDDRIIVCNEAASKMLNVDSITGQHVTEIFPDSRLPHIRITRTPEFNQKFFYKDNTYLVNRVPLIVNGEVVGAMAWFQDYSDIEELSKQINKVSEINKELDALIDNFHDGICITDSEGCILRLNKAFERITGLNSKEFIGVNLKEIVQKGIIDQSTALKVISERTTVNQVQDLFYGKQTINTGTPIFDEYGNLFRVLVNTRDLTELNYLFQELADSKLRAEQLESEIAELKSQQVKNKRTVALSKQMIEVVELVQRVAPTDATVLILGESGVGKEVIAKMVYESSNRTSKNFIKLNCSAIPHELLESELFGYESGSFTGARKEGKLGYFELAHEGTIFLDEISEMPKKLQAKLLRVLQEKEIMKIGGVEPVKIDVRIIAATNKDLAHMVNEGSFREDLFYRVNVIPIKISPLRERPEDISGLLLYYLNYYNKKYDTSKFFSKKARDALLNYGWPGNVRELCNIIERVLVTSKEQEIRLEDLPSEVNSEHMAAGYKHQGKVQSIMENVERKVIEDAFNKYKNTYDAAKAVGMSQSTFSRRVRKYGLNQVSKEESNQ